MAGILYWRLRWALSRHPYILIFFRCIPSVRHTVVTRKTDLLIEGYPRSGNTFARNAFLLACNNKYVLSSHLHFIANVKLAIRLDKPILILIRKPVEAVCSFMVYKGEHFPIEQALFEYMDFYTYVLKHRDDVVVASFDEVTASFGQVLERVNQRFMTEFPFFDHTPENVQHCIQMTHEQVSPWPADRGHWSETRKLSAPSSGRDVLKKRAKDRLLSEKNKDIIRLAERLYETLTESAG